MTKPNNIAVGAARQPSRVGNFENHLSEFEVAAAWSFKFFLLVAHFALARVTHTPRLSCQLACFSQVREKENVAKDFQRQ